MGSANVQDMIWVAAGAGHRRRERFTAPRRRPRRLSAADAVLREELDQSAGARYRSGASTAAEVLAYFRQALLLGYFPGFNGYYWNSSTAYERDRALVQAVHAADQEGRRGRLETGPLRDPLRCRHLRRTLRRSGRQHLLSDRPELLHRHQDLPDDRRRRQLAARARAPSPSRSSSATPPSPPPAPDPTSSSPIPSPPAKPPSTKSPSPAAATRRMGI